MLTTVTVSVIAVAPWVMQLQIRLLQFGLKAQGTKASTVLLLLLAFLLDVNVINFANIVSNPQMKQPFRFNKIYSMITSPQIFGVFM